MGQKQTHCFAPVCLLPPGADIVPPGAHLAEQPEDLAMVVADGGGNRAAEEQVLIGVDQQHRLEWRRGEFHGKHLTGYEQYVSMVPRHDCAFGTDELKTQSPNRGADG